MGQGRSTASRSSSGSRCFTGCTNRGATWCCRHRESDGNGARRLLAAHAGAAQSDRHVDRRSSARSRARRCWCAASIASTARRCSTSSPTARCSSRSRRRRPATSRSATHDHEAPPCPRPLLGSQRCWRVPRSRRRASRRFGRAPGHAAGTRSPACSSPGRRPRCWPMCWRRDAMVGWIRQPSPGREGIPRRPRARPAGDRPPDRPRRHGEPRAIGRGQARPRARFRHDQRDLRVAGRPGAGQTGIPYAADRRPLRQHAGGAAARRRHARRQERGAELARATPKRPSRRSIACWPTCRPTSAPCLSRARAARASRPARAARSTPRSSSASARSMSSRASRDRAASRRRRRSS